MEEIVISYLDKQYSFTMSTLYSFKLYDKLNKTEIYLKSLWLEIEVIFGLSFEDFEPIWEKWSDTKILEINNKITDMRYKLYEFNGTDIVLTTEEINKMLMTHFG